MIGGGRLIAHGGLDRVEAGVSTIRRRPSLGYRCFVLRGAGSLPAAGAPKTTPLSNTLPPPAAGRADVARMGFDAMMRGNGDVVSGWKNRPQSAIANVTPAAVPAAGQQGRPRNNREDHDA